MADIKGIEQQIKQVKTVRNGIFIFLTLIFIIVAILMSIIKPLTRTKNELPEFPLYKSKEYRKDCSIVRVFAMNDSTCENICTNASAYVARNGICVNSMVINQTPITNECDPSKGVLAILIGDSQVGQVNSYCVSTDPGIQDSNIKKRNIMCTGGHIKINYIDHFPQISDCECPADYNSVIIPATSVIRSYVVCSKLQI